MERPSVTVALQFYNNELTLSHAIQSIINQSFPDWELLLQDDGSTDQSLRVAHRFCDDRIRIFSDGLNKKRPARINECLAIARGKYFALMDGDDISYPDRLLKQVLYLETHPNVDLVGAHILVFNNRAMPLGKRGGPQTHEHICSRPWSGFLLAQPTFLGRVEWFRRYKYKENMTRSQDQDLLLRSYRFSRFANLPEIQLGYREEKIYLRKLLIWRWYFTQSATKEFCRQGRPQMALLAILEQGLKGIIDSVATGCGLNYRLLRHRARPITVAERETWQSVWHSVYLSKS